MIELYSRQQLLDRTKELARVIETDFQDTQSTPIFLGVLKGSFIFMANLLQEYSGECMVDFCRVKSYENNKQSELTFTKQWELDIEGCDIIIVEDIVDSGETIKFLLTELEKYNPKSVSICSLFKRYSCKDVNIDYLGFEIDDTSLIVGYGLDNRELQRNLKNIVKLN